MATLSIFLGLIIRMFNEKGGKHKVPHIHAYYGDNKAVFDLDGNKLEGELPIKKERQVIVWIDIHHDELIANWELLSNGEPFFKIDPLR